MASGKTLHASCVVVREAGILIRGPSGSGKSRLARDLIFEAGRLGRFARLVGDDRIAVTNRSGRLVATAVTAIAGKLEARGFGILTLPYESSAILRLVIDCLMNETTRLPEPGARSMILGVLLPRIRARVEPGLAQIILLGLDETGNTLMTEQ